MCSVAVLSLGGLSFCLGDPYLCRVVLIGRGLFCSQTLGFFEGFFGLGYAHQIDATAAPCTAEAEGKHEPEGKPMGRRGTSGSLCSRCHLRHASNSWKAREQYQFGPSVVNKVFWWQRTFSAPYLTLSPKRTEGNGG